jgi:putative holliday junction resolvase
MLGNMRILGIDYGSKRVGLALTNEEGTMAFPHTVLPNDEQLLKTIESLIEKEGVTHIVVGHSLNKAGEPNAVHARIEEFIQDLTLHIGLPVDLEPEQFTTQAALRIQGRNAMTDASAAALILDGFITRTHG